MKLNKFLFLYLFVAVFMLSCDKDDDSPEVVPPRDRGEQQLEDQAALEAYLDTHFYNYEEFENPTGDFDYRIEIDTINTANADKISLSESNLLEEKTITREGVDYKIYILKVREGEGEKPTFADSTFVAYWGQLLDRTTFDSSEAPVWFDLPGYVVATQGGLKRVGGIVTGLQMAIPEFRGASGYEVLPDNIVRWNNDYGIGAVFMPSGLGYFNVFKPNIPSYSPLVFTFNLYGVNQTDHDGDGVPSYLEDLDEDQNLFNDDTDGNGVPNHSDPDDDGDFIPTIEEISDEDGNIIFPYPDSDNDGTPDYLDPEF